MSAFLDKVCLALSRVEDGHGVVGCIPYRHARREDNSTFVKQLLDEGLIWKKNKSTPPRLTHAGRNLLMNWRQQHALERKTADKKSTQNSQATSGQKNKC